MEVTKLRYTLGRQSSMAPPRSEDDSELSRDALSLPDKLDKAMLLLFLSNKGDEKGIEDLIAEGADVNDADFDDRTALHVAACEGHVHIVELLLKHGANVNARDRWGSTPLLDAKHYGNKDVCEILVKAGAKVPQVSKQTPMEVTNPDDVPEYEVRAQELTNFKNDNKLHDYRVAKWNGTQVAVKEVPHDLSNQPDVVGVFREELALLQKLRHPNIVQFLGAVTQSPPMRIIVEYCAGGDLQWYLSLKGQLGFLKAVRYALDIARGLNYLHEWKPDAILHCRLRPRNILRDRVGRLKVADFYLGQTMQQASGSSRHYMAPELLLGKAFDTKVDVYSFGLILHQMIEGSSEFFSETEEELVQAVCHKHKRPAFKLKSKAYPDGLKELIEKCWHPNPSERPDFGHIISELEKIKPLCVKQSFWRRMLKTPKRTISLRSLSFQY